MTEVNKLRVSLAGAAAALKVFQRHYDNIDLQNEIQACDDASRKLDEQEKIIEMYHTADTFLEAHDWKWGNENDT